MIMTVVARKKKLKRRETDDNKKIHALELHEKDETHNTQERMDRSGSVAEARDRDLGTLAARTVQTKMKRFPAEVERNARQICIGIT